MSFARGILTVLKVDRRNRWIVPALATTALSLVSHRAEAQTTISTELTAVRTLDVSVEFMGSIARRASGGFEWYLTDLTFGVTPRLEIGAGWSAVVPGSSGEPHEIIPHAKFIAFESASTTFAAGGAWHVPAPSRAESRGYGWAYVAVSRAIDSARPITLSAGAYALVRRDRSIGDSARGISLGWDQSLSDRWSYSLEWISGTNWYGYLSPGITFSSGAHWFTGGYCVGNDRSANHGPCFSAGRTF